MKETNFMFPSDPNEICDTLFNTQTYFSRCVGYCTFHHGYVTEQQMKTKKCLRKNCNAFIKQASHEYWCNHEKQKQKRLVRKEKISRLIDIAESKKHVAQAKNEKPQKKANASLKVKRYICLDLEMCELVSKQRRSIKGLRSEIIQIGAVMLDENLNYISEFASFVKPVYGQISDEITELTGINDKTVEHADTFSTAFYKFYCWAGNDDITIFCWSDSDYKQLWDEIYVKAKGHDEYREFLRSFVDLQAVLGTVLSAEKAISLDAALEICHLKFKGQRHSALFDAYNTARILFKMIQSGKSGNVWNYIASYTESEMSKNHSRENTFDKDYTSSIASFVSPELLMKFGYSVKDAETQSVHVKKTGQESAADGLKKMQIATNKNRKIEKLLKKLFICSRYGIKLTDWLKFSIRMRFTRDLKIHNPVDLLVG